MGLSTCMGIVIMICMGGSRVIVTRHYMGDRYQQGHGGAVSKCPPSTPIYREDTAGCVAGLKGRNTVDVDLVTVL